MNAAGQRAFGLTQHGRWPGPGDVDLEPPVSGRHLLLRRFANAPCAAGRRLRDRAHCRRWTPELDRHGNRGRRVGYPVLLERAASRRASEAWVA
jgi:hypothetical protein